MASYANIIVDVSTEKLDHPFTYRIPDHLQDSLKVGELVQIPFGKGNRQIKGFVTGLLEDYQPERGIVIKEISDRLANPGVTGQLINLAEWMRQQYGGTLNQALKTVLPMKKSGKAREVKYVELRIEQEEAQKLIEGFERRHAVARKRLLTALLQDPVLELSVITTKLNVQASVVKDLEKAGYLQIVAKRRYRNPIPQDEKNHYRPILNREQQAVVEHVLSEYDRGERKTYLIHGVTGSGKTEVYMELMQHVIEEGRQVILLIPEIALTYQTVMRFYRRFGERVSVLHSRLSAGERFDQLERARNGEVDIMIGPRSALFTPFSRLGLIVIDEEHEATYKNENIPRFHARETAIYRAKQSNAFVVLGSATPSLESFYKARQGEYGFFRLQHRYNEKALPQTHLVDLREELRKGNRSIFSDTLVERIQDRLDKKQQIMLFLNRRGLAGFVSCRSCGKVLKCPHCDVSLTQHQNGILKCHYCGFETATMRTCPTCGSTYIGGFSVGTQKVEELLKKQFPKARILRMDADTTRTKDSYEKILSAFSNEEADILVGTQMIVKGHDFPNVTLVGILAADMSLNSEDYRAGERTFQLLTQAAGRAGRGACSGEVVIQTYNPDHYAVKLAGEQDYESFYEEEIAYRKMLRYPPCGHLLLIMIQSKDENSANRLAESIAEIAGNEIGTSGKELLLGPVDARVRKLQDVFRKAVYIKASDYARLLEIKNKIECFREKTGYQDGSVSFDFDPMNGF
ncbi:MAG: primosomal protein N' [Lachnospiraceae bacterium]